MDEPPAATSASPQVSPPTKREIVEALAAVWWLPLVRGVLLIALGGYALLTPGLTLLTYTLVLGIFVLADGVLALLAAALGWVESRGWMLVRGLLGVLAGLLVIAHPSFVGLVTAIVLIIIFGVQAIIGGVLEIYVAIRERKQIHGEWWLVLSGVLSIIFGLLLLARPILAVGVFIQILGIFAILFGIWLIVLAFRLKGLGARFDSAD